MQDARRRRACSITVVLVAIIVIGAPVLVTGGFRMGIASGARAGADELLRRQQDAMAAFHRDAAQVSKLHQAGGLDEAGWRRETQAVSARSKTESEAAGVAWADRLAAANHAEKQGLLLIVVGAALLIAGAVLVTCTARSLQKGEQ